MMRSSSLLLSSGLWLGTTLSRGFAPRFVATRKTLTTMSATKPFAVVVQAEIQPDRMEEFLTMIENNAVNSRKEPQCIRFDVLRDREDPNKFVFYEIYESVEAIDHHKAQDHYKAWATFKDSGGVVSSASMKMDAEFLT